MSLSDDVRQWLVSHPSLQGLDEEEYLEEVIESLQWVIDCFVVRLEELESDYDEDEDEEDE